MKRTDELEGCGPLGGLYGAVDKDATKIVTTAIKNGVNYLDTAYWYGQGRSEEVLGKVMLKVFNDEDDFICNN